ncbi:MAG: hypothetical protein P4L41_07055 [Flavipsychrobacter sp.]|nr:hypothetical protein [Flavipsychrobacter sp.]
MRQYFVIPALFTVLLSASCHSTKHSGKSAGMPGTWQATPIVVDADSKDWPSPYPNYDSKSFVGYATSNDKQYLYVTMETGDEYTEMKILKAGMTMWIDTAGGKGQSLAIHYPLPDDNEPFEMDRSKEKQGGQTGYDNKLRSQDFTLKVKRSVGNATQLTVEGLPYCSGGFAITQTNPCGIQVRIGVDEYKELIWEAAIPFKALYGKDTLTRADAGRPISVCFSIKGFKKPKSSGDSGAGNGMSNGGGAGGHGGGMGGGGRGMGGKGGGQGQRNGTDPKEQLYETTRTYKYFGLAYQQ